MKKRILEIESKIIAITGDRLDRWTHWSENREKRELVEDLLRERCEILNDMFIPTSENMDRFNRVNNHLALLTQKLHDRVSSLIEQVSSIEDKTTFDDDVEIEGWLRVVFDGEKSVLKLDDDTIYGSNFALMLKILTELYDEAGLSDVEYSYDGVNYLDDGTSWMDVPFCCWPEFRNIMICHAVHDLTNHKSYSIPDLIRLNDFWCEAQIRFQNITEQDGTRWNKNTQ